jgi:hypothetical protein
MPDMWMDVDSALTEVPVNKVALIDDTDFKTREESVVYNQAGLDLVWNFVTSAGAYTQTAVTPTAAGDYDWTNQGNGMYSIEIPASGGASINNDTEGYGWFTGFATGILPWTGPIIGFRAAAINNALIDGGDVLDVNVTEWLGTAAATPSVAGVPEVDVTHTSGVAEDIATETKQDIIDTVVDAIKAKTDSLTFTVANQVDANAVAVSGDSTAADNLESQYDGTGVDGNTFPATQAQLNNIVNVGSAVNTPAESYTLTTGTQSANTYVETSALDGVRHEHTDSAGVLELYYQFDIGNEGSPTSITMTGYLTGGNDSVGVYAYNWAGTSWDQIGTLQGGAASDDTSTYALYAASHVGTGANAGKVRIRYYAASGLTTATLAVDQIYISYAIVRQTVGYALGAFWINTVSGTAGTEAYYNATADNPVDSLTDAQTLSSSIPLNNYQVSNDSSITLAAAFEASIMEGSGYTLAFGGQSISGSRISGASVSGTCTGANPIVLSNCTVNAVTLPIATVANCNIEDTITLGSAGEYHLHNSHCGNVAGVAIDFGAALGDNQILVHDWQGELDLQNMGQTGTDVAHIAGTGILTINANCTGGTVYYQGDWDFTDNSGGAVTVISDDNIANIVETLADTNELQTDWANGGRLDLLIDQIITNIAALNDLSAADVNAEMVDVLFTDTQAELSAVPAANAPLADKLAWVFLLARNKITQTSTTQSVKADDGTTDVATASVSDDGSTFSREEFS